MEEQWQGYCDFVVGLYQPGTENNAIVKK